LLTDNAMGMGRTGDRIYTICSSERGFVIAVLSARDLAPIAQHAVPQVREAHSICVMGDTIYAVSTGTDEVFAVDMAGDTFSEPRVVWRATNSGRDSHHLNSLIEVAGELFVSGFGPKTDTTWTSATNGYIHNISRDVRLRDGIYQPHSLSVRNQRMYYCESHNRTFCSLDGPLFRLVGYSRGVTWLSDDLVLVGASILRTVSKSTGLAVDPADSGPPPDSCGVTLYDLARGRELFHIDLSWFGPETYDLVLLDQPLDPLQLAVSAQLAERASLNDLRALVEEQKKAGLELSQQNQVKDQELSATVQELQQIKNSMAWRLAALLGRWRARLSPAGSWREQIARRLFGGIATPDGRAKGDEEPASPR
jgi:hypothetical protein